MLLMGAILRWFAVEKPVSSIYFWLVVRCRCEKYSLLLQRTVKKYFDVGSSMVEVKPLTISKVRLKERPCNQICWKFLAFWMETMCFVVDHSTSNCDSVDQLSCPNLFLHWRTFLVYTLVSPAQAFYAYRQLFIIYFTIKYNTEVFFVGRDFRNFCGIMTVWTGSLYLFDSATYRAFLKKPK